jgi:DNA-binding NtrC family response regulator
MALGRNGSGEIVRAYPADTGGERLVFASRESASVAERLQALGPQNRAVLFVGEIGTGKTAFARALQRASAAPIRLQINCASLTESEVADLATTGLQSVAEGGCGSLLLDEVAELSPWAQAVLLNALERNLARAHNVRLIATTHRNLDELVRSGRFSTRLASLLSDELVHLLPLRARREDIVPLALHLLRMSLGRSAWDFVAIDPMVLSCLEQHTWPGNARELKNTMERALALAVDGDISLRELPEMLVWAKDRAL